MARVRSIKPGFFLNDELAALPMAARILFAGLWCVADRRGRLYDRPVRIKAEVLPYDACDVDALLTQLADQGFLLRYSADGVACIQIRNFEKHQHVHIKEPESTIPAPPAPSSISGESGASTVQAPGEHRSDPSAAAAAAAPDPDPAAAAVRAPARSREPEAAAAPALPETLVELYREATGGEPAGREAARLREIAGLGRSPPEIAAALWTAKHERQAHSVAALALTILREDASDAEEPRPSARNGARAPGAGAEVRAGERLAGAAPRVARDRWDTPADELQRVLGHGAGERAPPESAR